MGSRDQHPETNGLEDDVDLDADTKEDTEEIFCNQETTENTEDAFCDEETAESPHKVILWYDPETPRPITEHLPAGAVHKKIGESVTLGRQKLSDVLLYEEHMARCFASITCYSTPRTNPRFVMRNTTTTGKGKRISFTDPKGKTTNVMPGKETELVDQSKFKLECLEFTVSIELGDVSSRTFDLQCKKVDSHPHSNVPQNANGQGGAYESLPLETGHSVAHVGLSLGSLGSLAYPEQQVLPKAVAAQVYPAPGIHLGSYNLSLPPEYQMSAPSGVYPPGMMANYGVNTQIGPPPYSQRVAYAEVPHSGYPSHQSIALNQNVNGNRGVLGMMTPTRTHLHQQHPAVNQYQGQMLFPHGTPVAQMSQTLTPTHLSPPPYSPATRGIVTTPSTVDRNPAFYPSPAAPRFRFPQPQGHDCPQSPQGYCPDLSDLPRGPPLGDLHPSASDAAGARAPVIPTNVVTTVAVTETSGGYYGDDHAKTSSISKKPVEHEEPPR